MKNLVNYLDDYIDEDSLAEDLHIKKLDKIQTHRDIIKVNKKASRADYIQEDKKQYKPKHKQKY